MSRLSPLLLLALLHPALTLPCPAQTTPEPAAATPTADAYTQGLLDWRAKRATRLTAPDGWLTVVGRSWLKPGANTIGSAPDNSIVLAKAPTHLGTVTLDTAGDRIIADFLPGTGALIDGKPAVSGFQLRHDASGEPSSVTVGTLLITFLRRGERTAIRTRDSDCEARLNFAGLEYFPIDPSWRIEARWVPFDPPRKISVTNVIGQTSEQDAPGKAVFERDGITYELIPTEEEGELFFVLRDATSGRETYGASRFLYADAPKDGKVLLDFNKAYNPPCAFTDFATCPLPIPENRLKLGIRAGEKTYKGSLAH